MYFNSKMNVDNVLNVEDIKFITGSATDIGGCKENQDTKCCFQNEDIVVNGIFDGHGSDGKWIAEFCKFNTEIWMLKNNDNILLEPVKALTEYFVELTKLLYEKTIEKYTNDNRECKIDETGVILIKNIYNNNWQPSITGGATITVSILIKKTLKLYIANIGDSDAILCSSTNILRQFTYIFNHKCVLIFLN